MQPNYRPCPTCGAMQPQTGQQCTQCGRPLPQSGPAAPGYSVPQGYSAPMPPQGAPLAPPPMGYGAPPPQGAVPPGYGRPLPPPKKKSRAPLVIILCTVAVVLIGGGLAAFFLLGGGGSPDTTQADYDALASKIVAQESPASVAAYAGELSDFVADHPTVQANSDLSALVDACAEYAGGDPDSEARYTTAERALGRLAEADNADIADCAYTMLGLVREEYEEFVNYYTDPTPPPTPDPTPPTPDPPTPSSETTPVPPSSGGTSQALPFDDAPYSLDELDWASTQVYEGDMWYSFSFTNTSDKTIVFAEALVFCYDIDGNPVYDEYGDNWDWGWTYDVVIAPGETYTLEDYLAYLSPDDVSYIFPVILYTEYEDGSTWGLFSEDTETEPLYAVYDEVNAQVDAMVAAAFANA